MPSYPKPPTQITGPVLLLVEGPGDQMFFDALLKYLNQNTIQTWPFDGVDTLEQRLTELLSVSNFREKVKSIGVVVDCDKDPQENFAKITTVLENVELPAPKQPFETVIGHPQVSIMLIPDENTPGMLEDLCLKSVKSDPALSCVHQYFECLKTFGLALPNNISKAMAQTYLASKTEVGFGVGRAAQEDHGYWNWENKAFDSVKAFLQQITSFPLE